DDQRRGVRGAGHLARPGAADRGRAVGRGHPGGPAPRPRPVRAGPRSLRAGADLGTGGGLALLRRRDRMGDLRRGLEPGRRSRDRQRAETVSDQSRQRSAPDPILFGVVGGAAAFGVLGLFLGPTLLAVGYELIREWHMAETPDAQPSLAD